jgi:ribosomal protein S12 methylthiotransferase accessory factor YcaO
MRPATYAACCALAASLTLGVCAAGLAAANGAAAALAHRRCVTEAALSRLSPEHCATRPAPVISTATSY